MLKLHMSWSLEIFRGMLLNGDTGGFAFFWDGLPGKGGSTYLGEMWTPQKLWYGSNSIFFSL